MFIPVNEPILSKDAKNNAKKAIDTVWISSSGSFVNDFEEAFANYYGVDNAITTSSGTAALHIALLSLGIGKNDEVIVPAFTMAASWLSIIYTSATPVFVDCELYTYNIDVNKIEEKITHKTKAIMPVHIYGHPCDMLKIMQLANKYNLKIIEDSAEVHGADIEGKLAGTFGAVGCFSFYANKILTTGEGGMVITNNDNIAYYCRKYKDLYHSDEKRFIHKKIGFNYRMTNIQAGIGLGELKHLNEYIKIKQEMARRYDNGLKDIPGIKIPYTQKGIKNVYWMYAILIDRKKFGIDRDTLRIKLKEKNIDTRDFFYSPIDQPILKPYITNSDNFPNTEYIAQNGLYLPSGLAITNEQINKVIDDILKIHNYEKHRI